MLALGYADENPASKARNGQRIIGKTSSINKLLGKLLLNEYTNTRIIPFRLDITLMTTLSFEINVKEIEGLYFKRLKRNTIC